MQARKSHKKAIISVAVAMVVLSITTVVFAKYALPVKSGYKQADSAKFYLTTSIAPNDEEHPYVCSDEISFTISNNDELNVAEKDIDFSISVEGTNASTAKIKIDGATTNEATLSVDGANHISSDVHISNLSNGEYTVTISSSYPYETQTKLYFKATQGSQKSTYKVTKHDNWTELDVYTGSDASDITITYTGYSPDNTNDYMTDWGTNGPEALSGFNRNSHYKLVFFGDGTFSLEQNGEALAQL